ncbi:methylmalonic acid semialdehyde dehydrogenase [Halobacteroides halobius DSM 5150]|uniref:methylmalonate-semialdehyde dehydrogenase (CoA acylating) n=1 Tax=Halobacteroides halobius (strain ATCC 35273 / DSM 5150 / MD-1) TaxID=748449 RepID=L0KBK2_HALHC|nr:CoA-acylating methylmalonate-semialdehyde dehydrogenase [Halobacteroides halobius]AGB42376.1 methylmalonic acid semialdehyde dehydrogenase [Halobacteroides halobius DSM 5150]
MVEELKNHINGEWVSSSTDQYVDVINPATTKMIGKTPMSTTKEVEEAIQTAKESFWEWRSTPPVERARYLFKLQNLIEENYDRLSEAVVEENGKNIKSARAEVQRALENVEVAAGIPSLVQGYNSEDIARGIDEKAIKQPMGVFTCIVPFNFPAMIPFWFVPYAIATGNTYIIKPSEKVPYTAQILMELIEEAGIPEGVVNLVHGGKEVSTTLLESDDIEGVSFVGSTPVAKKVYTKAAMEGKRAQCQGGACNFITVMPDANLEAAKSNIFSSFFACAGQRCLAGQNLVAVGDETYDQLKEMVVEQVPNIKVGYGLDEGVEMGPLITAKAKESILSRIDEAIDQGAKVLVDGRDIEVEGYEDGHFIGPVVLTGDIHDLDIVHEEIFGPVMNLIKVDTFEEARDLINSNNYGNAANIYTQSGKWARKFAYEVEGGNIGINIGVPAPVPHFPFSGMKDSFFGDLHAQGRDVIDFYTEKKIVIERYL